MIEFRDPKRLKLRITDKDIMKDHSMKWTIRNMKFSISSTIFGVETYRFEIKKDYKEFIEWYEMLYDSKKFQEEYKTGKYDHLFNKNGTLKSIGRK